MVEKLVQLCCCFTPAHGILFERVFAPSVPKGFDLCSTLVDEAGAGDYLSLEFLRCIRKKLGVVQESFERFQGGIVVWSDVDIRFVDLDPRDLESRLFSSGADILFQRESPRMGDVNTGFFVCRANSAVQSLFGKVQKLLEENPAINEQMAMNQILSSRSGTSVPVWNFLPKTYYARTHGWPPPRNIALYHANYTKGPDAVGQKLAQFRELESLLHGGWPARFFSIAKRIPGKLLRSRTH